jgi:CheY-like chemotaxis protein
MARNVLIVEDEVINAMALAEVMPGWGFDVLDVVTSGEEAVRVAQTTRPDVVLLDIAIHGSINGIGAAREIIGRLGIPVIFMTGYNDEETLNAANSLKPMAVLVKPLDAERLRGLLQSM